MNSRSRIKSRGQALIEFTLMVPVIIIVLAGLTDLGLAFFVGMATQNAVREGARIAATNADLDGSTGEEGFDANINTARTAVKDAVINRIPAITQFVLPDAFAGMPGAPGVYISNPGGDTTCTADVSVSATGTYNFAFLKYIGFTTIQISRTGMMRYEDRPLCT